MEISAIGYSPIKPEASFGKVTLEKDRMKNLDERYDEIVEQTDKLNDAFVKSSQIKTPLAVAASIGMAVLVTFLTGRKAAGIISNIQDGKIPKIIIGGMEKAADAIKNKAANLAKNPKKAVKILGSAIGTVEDNARKAFTQVTGGGFAKPVKAFETIGGAVAVAATLPGVLSSDKDGNGVSDIMEKGQNAYTGSKTIMNGAVEKVGLLADLIDNLT